MHFNSALFHRPTLLELLRLSLPMVVSQGAFAVMIFTDRYFMSQIDPLHMAAAMGGGVASFFSMSLFLGLLAYSNALVAQYFGAGEKDKCARVVSQGVIIAVACMPVLLLIAYFVADLFSAMGHQSEQVKLEKIYYQLLVYGSFLPLSKVCLASYFSGIGNTRIVMICDVLGMMLNIPLSYILIFGKFGLPELGIVGAAWGTIFSSCFALLLFLFFYLRSSNRLEFSIADSFRFDRGIMKRFIRLGLPSGLEMFLNVAAFNLFLLMFQSYGIPQAAAATIVFNWDILAFVPMLGLNIGVISLVGRFVGANNMQRTNQVIASAFLVALAYTGALALLFVFFRVPLVKVFVQPGGDGDLIIELASFMMLGLATYVMADGLRIVASGVLRGAGDTRWLMRYSALLNWLMLLAQYFIIRVLHADPRASWILFVIMIIALTCLCLWRLFGGKWRDPQILQSVMIE